MKVDGGWRKNKSRMVTCVKFKSIEICIVISEGKSEVVGKGVLILGAWH